MTRILTLLRSPGAMLIALVAALAAQAEHTAQVFSMVVQAQGIFATLHAYAFACAVEIAVLLFVLAGHRRISYGFALATFATNLSYYAMHDVPLLSLAGAPAWLMSLLLPAAIVGYSHTIAETPQGALEEKATNHTAASFPSPVTRPSAILGHSHATNAQVRIYQQTNALHIRISDDGEGFNCAQNAESNGLRNFQNRAKEGGVEVNVLASAVTLVEIEDPFECLG